MKAIKKKRKARTCWTKKDGRSNSSELFESLSKEIGRMIKASAHDLFNNQSENVGRLILARLAHEYNFGPLKRKARE